MDSEEFPTRECLVLEPHRLQTLLSCDSIQSTLSQLQTLPGDVQKLIVINVAAICAELREKGRNLVDIIISRLPKLEELLVREFLYNIEQLVDYLIQYDWGHRMLTDDLFNCLLGLLAQKPQKVDSRQVMEAVGTLLGKVDPVARQDRLLTRLLLKAHSEQPSQRFIALLSFSSVGTLFGEQACQNIISSELLSIASFDQNVTLKLTAMRGIMIVSEFLGGDAFKRKFQNFYLECCEEADREVRLRCVEYLPWVARLVDDITREILCTEIILNFLQCKRVECLYECALVLIEFLPFLEGLPVNKQLLVQLHAVLSRRFETEARTVRVRAKFMYNFAKILKVVGAVDVDPLFSSYMRIVREDRHEYQLAEAQTLHEVAAVLGDSHSKFLFREVEKFAYSPNEDLKLRFSKHLVDLMTCFKQLEHRMSLIDFFTVLSSCHKKWKVRLAIAEQIHKLIAIFPPDAIERNILPIVFKYCNDSVALVRERSAYQVRHLFKLCGSSPSLLTLVMFYVSGFAESRVFRQRQTFLFICQEMLDPECEALFRANLMEGFCRMAQDGQPLVKNLLAVVLRRKRDSMSEPLRKDLARVIELIEPFNL